MMGYYIIGSNLGCKEFQITEMNDSLVEFPFPIGSLIRLKNK